jgi:hypothetical protein
MRKLNLFTVFFIIVAFMACKKDNKTSSTDLNSLTYSSKDSTEIKADLESTGSTLITQLSNLNNETGMQATVNLISLLDVANSVDISLKSAAFRTLKSAAALSNGTTGVEGLFSTLRQTSDEIGLLQAYDSIAGTYTYNFETGGFDKEAASTFSVKFPATLADKTAKKLSGVFEIAKPTVQTGSYIYGDETVTELPTSIQYDIKVNDNTALNYAFTAAYNTSGMPTSVTSILTIGTFIFNTTWGYSTADVSLNYSIKNSSTTIIDMGWEMTGNFDKTNIQTVNNSVDPDPTLILTNSNAHLQFYNIKIAGQIDFKDFYNGLISIENESSADTVKQTEAVALIKSDMALVVVYADNSQMIAKAEPYLKPYQYTDWYWNSTTQSWASEVVTEYEIDMRMVFADKSKSDLSTYFQSGFSSLTGDFNTFIHELNTTYGWSIDNVK